MTLATTAPQSSREIDAALDRRPLGALQWRVAILCALVAMLDGFDTQAAAFVAPVLARDWSVDPRQFGLIFAAGLVGIMIGQVLLGPLADRIGRRPVVLLCTAVFAAGSLATTLASGPTSLLLLRLATGIGLGGATPNIIALTAEFSPPRLRATLITSMFAGFPLGAALGAGVSATLIPTYGWQSVFLLGGLAPLLLLIPLCFGLPESPHFLAHSGRDPERLRSLLDRLCGREAPRTQIDRSAAPVAAARPAWASVAALWSPSWRATTALLWVAYFNSLLVVYFMMNWLPTIARESGWSLDSALISSVFLNLGGAAGGILLGRLADRFGAFRVLAVGYATGGASLALLGMTPTTTALMLLVFVAGLCTIGGQTAMNAATTARYPAEFRATALGLALAVGRVGSIVGPTVGGVLLAAQWPMSAVFLAVACPAMAVAVIALALHHLRGRSS